MRQGIQEDALRAMFESGAVGEVLVSHHDEFCAGWTSEGGGLVYPSPWAWFDTPSVTHWKSIANAIAPVIARRKVWRRYAK